MYDKRDRCRDNRASLPSIMHHLADKAVIRQLVEDARSRPSDRAQRFDDRNACSAARSIMRARIRYKALTNFGGHLAVIETTCSAFGIFVTSTVPTHSCRCRYDLARPMAGLRSFDATVRRSSLTSVLLSRDGTLGLTKLTSNGPAKLRHFGRDYEPACQKTKKPIHELLRPRARPRPVAISSEPVMRLRRRALLGSLSRSRNRPASST